MPNLPHPKKSPSAAGWQRRTNQRFHHSRAWRLLRGMHVGEHPFCVVCFSTKNIHVDHVIGIDFGGAELDQRNLMTLCRTHHARKTAMERHGLNLDSTGEQGAKIPTTAAIRDIKNRLK